MKNLFWKGERNAGKKMIGNEMFEMDNLQWQFEELIKTLIAMTLSLEEQENFYGMGATADEMLQDFYSYYTRNKSDFLHKNLINKESKELLEDLDTLIDKWSDEKGEDFWVEMQSNEIEWDILRQKARLTLRAMKKDNLTVEVNHQNEVDKEGNIVSQRTQTELKAK